MCDPDPVYHELCSLAIHNLDMKTQHLNGILYRYVMSFLICPIRNEKHTMVQVFLKQIQIRYFFWKSIIQQLTSRYINSFT